MRILPVTLAGCIVFGATTAFAQNTLVELDVSASQTSRSGSAVNSSGFGDELEGYSLAKIAGSVAHRFDNDVVVQGTLIHDESFADTLTTAVIPGLFESDETYQNGQQFTLQLGRHQDEFYFGGFATVGEVRFKPVDEDQDTSFNSLGVQMGWYGDQWSLSTTVGVLDSTADNPESIDNAVLFGIAGTYHFNDKTSLSASVSKLSGDQDTDSSGGADPVDITMAGLEIEHQIIGRSTYDLALYGGVDRIDVREDSSAPRIDRATDTILSLGVRIRYGAQSGASRDRQRTPALPEMLRAIGAVPIVD